MTVKNNSLFLSLCTFKVAVHDLLAVLRLSVVSYCLSVVVPVAGQDYLTVIGAEPWNGLYRNIPPWFNVIKLPVLISIVFPFTISYHEHFILMIWYPPFGRGWWTVNPFGYWWCSTRSSILYSMRITLLYKNPCTCVYSRSSGLARFAWLITSTIFHSTFTCSWRPMITTTTIKEKNNNNIIEEMFFFFLNEWDYQNFHWDCAVCPINIFFKIFA